MSNSILNYLPKFKVLENNRLIGLRHGHDLSQFKADASITTVTAGTKEAIENGLIVGLNADLTIGNYDRDEHNQPFVVFVEELNTFLDGLQYYATFEDADGDLYPRAIALYIGDAFTTNNFAVAGAVAPKFAKVVAGVLTLQDVRDEDSLFAVNASTMPADSELAYKFTYLGVTPIAVV